MADGESVSSEGEGQGHLFDLDADLPANTDPAEPASSDDAIDVQGHRRRRKKREIDWDKLPQIRHEHDLPEEEKICSCCGRPMDRIGEDVTRELELQPAKLEAHIHVRPKYACRCCKEGVCAAPLPQRPIPGGIAGPGLVSEVIVSKFGDHLPLYRLEDILVRSGVYIARSTLCDWVKFAAELFKPLVRAATPAGPAIDGDVDGRHARHGHGRSAREFSRSLLDLHWTRAALLGVRLHQESHVAMGRQVFCRDSRVICTRMLSPVTTRSFSVRTRPFGKWPVGRMRGGNSSMP